MAVVRSLPVMLRVHWQLLQAQSLGKLYTNANTVGVCALMQETDYDYVTIHSVMFYL